MTYKKSRTFVMNIRDYIIYTKIFLARCYTISLISLVDAANDSEEEDACGANSEGELCVAIALECWEWLVSLVDEHSLYNQQIVVE